MIPIEWDDVLKCPCFVINLERCPERRDLALRRIRDVGFQDIRRVVAVDTDDLAIHWENHGNPPMDKNDRDFCELYKGAQGCFLSHANVLKQALEEQLAFFLVFEDDVLFHKHFQDLAPMFWKETPAFDMLYLGSQLERASKAKVVQLPCFCTHAMAMTYEGAKKLYAFLFSAPVRRIDCILKDYHERVCNFNKKKEIVWYAWNNVVEIDEQANMKPEWKKRNSGLVFQDETLGSDIR